MAVPGKVLYFDCFVVAEGTFRLSWGLPIVSNHGDSAEALTDISSMGVIDSTVTHAVIQYMDKGEVHKVAVDTSPYTFTGTFE